MVETGGKDAGKAGDRQGEKIRGKPSGTGRGHRHRIETGGKDAGKAKWDFWLFGRSVFVMAM